MAHNRAIEALYRTLQDIRSNRKLMSGVTLLMAGDFRQTLPVVLRGNVSSLLLEIDLKNVELKDLSWFKERAILTPKNDTAESINNLLLEKLPSEIVHYQSVDSVVEIEDAVHYPVEFLHTLNTPGIPPHHLYLKVGVPIMLLRNLVPPKLCKGTRLQIKALRRHVIQAVIYTGCGQGEEVFIPSIPLIPSDYHFQFKRLQFPVKLCFDITINKSQGQSLKIAGVDLREDCFSHG
ncbi:uncharacterized protein LOC124358198 [Homalodisca vitripennis]|uniref:uncharacterized protein LOC124358198 n=1 Tax=Homalodisca vitripennis TaxID=197043 RepID=UPI001EEC6853|nr:uncharacterized protein LOC124358198 [Homalodisca vitripennis]